MSDITPKPLYSYPDLAVLNKRFRLAIDGFASVWKCRGYQNGINKGDGFCFVNLRDKTDWRVVNPQDKGYIQPVQEDLL